MSKIRRKVYVVERTETRVRVCHIQAESYKQARDILDDDCYDYDDSETYYVKHGKARNVRVDVYDTCPNAGHAWTDIPLADIESGKIEPGEWKWHYNGRCDVEKLSTNGHCHVCTRAMNMGRRLLTLQERRYLMERYPGDKPELLVT